MNAHFDQTGTPTPYARASIVGEYVRVVGLQLSGCKFSDLFDYMLEHASAKEEQVGPEIYVAHALAVRAGLAESNTGDRIEAGTVVRAGSALRDFVWQRPDQDGAA